MKQGDKAEMANVYGGLGEGKVQISEDYGRIPFSRCLRTDELWKAAIGRTKLLLRETDNTVQRVPRMGLANYLLLFIFLCFSETITPLNIKWYTFLGG